MFSPFSSLVTLGWRGSWLTRVVVLRFVKTSQLLAQFTFLIHILTQTRKSSQNNSGFARSSSYALGYASSAQKEGEKKPKNKSKSIVSGSGKFQIPHDFHLASCCGWISACESSSFISYTSPGPSTVSLSSPKWKTLQVNCDYKYEIF